MNTQRIDEGAWNYAGIATESMNQDGRWLLENHIHCGHHSKDTPHARQRPAKLQGFTKKVENKKSWQTPP